MSEGQGKIHDIKYAPTDGLTYNPNDPKYWDETALDQEIVRSFDLCHGCRMCFKYCDSFPTLFAAVDATEDADVRKLSPETRDTVIDQCFQCKLCYTQCPYTEDEGHEFKLDFPRLLQRANAVRRRKSGIPLRERMLADPDRLGKLGTIASGLSNWANTLHPHRVLMEKAMGIHRDKKLPDFAGQPFPNWFREQTRGAETTEDGRHAVVLFSTCFVNWNHPEVGKAAYRVLRKNDCKISCPEGVRCCGMPALDGGDVAFAKKQAAENVRALAPHVARGATIAVVNPTCSLMIKKEYPELLDDPADPGLAETAREVAAATRDLSEFLNDLRKDGAFNEDFRSTPDGPVSYHAPCHLRMQNIGFRGRDLMRRIPGTKPKLVQECCGHDGTWAMKKEHFEDSLRIGKKAFDGMEEAAGAVWATDCPLAAVQFEQACGRKAYHPIEVLDRAYREDGFPKKVEPKND